MGAENDPQTAPKLDQKRPLKRLKIVAQNPKIDLFRQHFFARWTQNEARIGIGMRCNSERATLPPDPYWSLYLYISWSIIRSGAALGLLLLGLPWRPPTEPIGKPQGMLAFPAAGWPHPPKPLTKDQGILAFPAAAWPHPPKPSLVPAGVERKKSSPHILIHFSMS